MEAAVTTPDPTATTKQRLNWGSREYRNVCLEAEILEQFNHNDSSSLAYVSPYHQVAWLLIHEPRAI
jgi:hypothetical protein